MPYVYSMQSTVYGGFIASPCDIVKRRENGVVLVNVVRNFAGKYRRDPGYEVFEEQVFDVQPTTDVVRCKLEDAADEINGVYKKHGLSCHHRQETAFSLIKKYEFRDRLHTYKTDEPIWVHARQIWKDFNSERHVKARVRQNQLSPICSVLTDAFGGSKNEFYPEQIEPRKENYYIPNFDLPWKLLTGQRRKK